MDIGQICNHPLCFNRFYYYLGNVKPTDQEMSVLEKVFYYSYRSQEREYTSPPRCGRATWESIGIGHKEERGELWARAFVVGRKRQDRVSRPGVG